VSDEKQEKKSTPKARKESESPIRIISLEPKKVEAKVKASVHDVLEQFKNARLVLIEEQNKLEDLLFDKQRQQSQELAEARRKRRED
jgi:hypothetical protein